MSDVPLRRFHRMHEQLLLSRWFSLIMGWGFSVALPLALYWNIGVILSPNSGQQTAIIVTSIAFVLCNISVRRLLATHPGGRSGIFIAPQVLTIYILLALMVLLLRVEVSRFLLIACGAAALVWFHIEYFLTSRYRRLKFAIIKGGVADELLSLKNMDVREVYSLELDTDETRYDGVVADFSTLDSETERFLTTCALNRIAVYDAKAIFESFTGRVKINRMSENNIGSLLPSINYERTKRVLDWALVVCSLPIVVPICLFTALLIKFESPGPVLYSQTRIGQGNKPFTIYKFRSMRVDPAASQQFAGENDPRITRVGRIIRKLRIDELPQFYNVIRGDMSLIGPRPEQPSFVAEFDEKIPFYSYRHVVKPGITGWAQVLHGYAADADQTQVKIEHDFYYIKNCSLLLDFYIIVLTIRTVLTGFGAR